MNQLSEQIRPHRKKIVLGLIVVISLLIFTNYSVLIIESDPQTNQTVLTIQSNTDNIERGKKISDGFRIIRTGDYRLELTKAESSTAAHKVVRPLRINRQVLTLTEPRSMVKVTRSPESADCVIGGVKDQNLYTCVDSRVRSSSPNDSVSQIAIPGILLLGEPIDYKSGILGFIYRGGADEASTPGLQLAYITRSGAQIVIKDASNLTEDATSARLSANSKGEFVITIPEKYTHYVYSDLSDKKPDRIEYKEYTGEGVVLSSVATQFVGDYLYTSQTTQRDSGDDKEDRGDHAEELVVLRFSVNTPTDKPVQIRLPRSINAASSVHVNETNLFVYDGLSSVLSILDLKNKKTELASRVSNVDSVAMLDSRLFYISQQKLFEYSTVDQTSQLLSNLRLSVSKFSASNNTLLVTGTPVNSTGNTASYALDPESKSSKPDLFNLFPYNLDELPILNSDYLGNTLYFSIKLDSMTIDGDNGQTVYDPVEYELKKDVVIRRLQQDGISSNKYRVVFKAGP